MFINITLTIIDVLIVTFVLYKTIMLLLGTRAFAILKGVAVVLILWLLSGVVGLATLKFIISQLSLYGILALIILFQPELRNALETLGRRNLNYKTYMNKDTNTSQLIEDITQAIAHMSKRKIGALICIELEDSLSEHIKTGINLNANISKELLINIFTPNVPLHDGALIIKGNRAEAAGCFLPLSDSTSLPKELGTRHRASLGLSEASDALSVVVSEETGNISITKDGTLQRKVSLEELRTYLENTLNQKKEKPKRLPLWKGGFNHGKRSESND